MKTAARWLFAVIVSFVAGLSSVQALTLSGTVCGGATPMVGTTVTPSATVGTLSPSNWVWVNRP